MIRYLVCDSAANDPLKWPVKLGTFCPMFDTEAEADQFIKTLEKSTGEEMKDLYVFPVEIQAVPLS